MGRMKGAAAVGCDSGGGEGWSRVLFLRCVRLGRSGTSTGADAEGWGDGLGADVGGSGDDLGVGIEKLKGKALAFESDIVVSIAGVEGCNSEDPCRTGTGR
jgi:hypothetical protein